MNELFTDIGYNSLIKDGEEVCGDRVEVAGDGEKSTVVVLADGLGSGVKACILSTLTAKMLSTMLADGMSVEESVRTIAQTLPVCSERGLAYSTFTAVRVENNRTVEIVNYDNPMPIALRGGQAYDYPVSTFHVEEKEITRTHFTLQDGDTLVLLSDGVQHAGVPHGGASYKLGWGRDNIVSFLEIFAQTGFNAKTLTTVLLGEVYERYTAQPGDDSTVCTISLRRRRQVNLMIGPPANREDERKMMSLFFSKQGKTIVCGGTTSKIVAAYLDKPYRPGPPSDDPDVPACGEIEGVDLVTEGVLTINRVLQYAQDFLRDNDTYTQWGYKKDGASRIARMLFEEATDINFFVGRAMNPAHEDPDMPIHFSIKMRLIEDLAEALRKMGKQIKVSYF